MKDNYALRTIAGHLKIVESFKYIVLEALSNGV